MLKKKVSILLIGGNYYPEPTGIGKYNGEMIDWLSVQNYKCGVITTYPYYPFWKIQEPYVNKSSWYKTEQRKTISDTPITIYRCPHYVPLIPTGLKRILSDLSLFVSAFFQVIRLLFRKKYDYVFIAAPPFQLGLLGIIYKKIKGAKIIYHVQDLQIDAAVELGMIKSKFIVQMFFYLETFILRKSDIVSSISEGMIRKIKAKFNREIILFPNWADTETFFPISNKEYLAEQYKFSPTDKIVLYAGAIGEKQGLQGVLYSANELKECKDIKFIICGSGPYKDRLVALAQKMSLQNVHFMPLQPIEKFNQFLNLAHIHLIIQKGNNNDMFMPSKLSTILSVGGLSIVTASKNTGLYNVIEKNNIAILIEPENSGLLTETIKNSIYQANDIIKNNARNFANNYLAIDKVVSAYFSEILNLAKRKSTFLKIKNEEPSIVISS